MEQVIRVGMATALSGRYSGPGRQALAGVQAWIDDTNRAGGLWLRDRGMHLPLCLIYYDDTSQAERCGVLTERLIVEDQVDVLLGPYASGPARQAAAVAHRHRHVLWNHGGASDAIYTAGYAWVVGILTPASQYFRGVIDVMRRLHPSAQRMAIIHSTAGRFPREVASGAAQYCRAQSFACLRMYPYMPGTADFAPLLRQLGIERPHLLLGVGRIEDDLRFATQFVHSDLTVDAVGLIATPLTLFRNTLGEKAEGFLGPSQWELGMVTVPEYGPSVEAVLQSLKAHGLTAVDYPMAQAYAGCLVAQRCIEVAGSLDQQALRQAASHLDVTTFYGRYRIEPTTGRQLGHVMPVVQWRAGVKVVVWPPPQAA